MFFALSKCIDFVGEIKVNLEKFNICGQRWTREHRSRVHLAKSLQTQSRYVLVIVGMSSPLDTAIRGTSNIHWISAYRTKDILLIGILSLFMVLALAQHLNILILHNYETMRSLAASRESCVVRPAAW